MSQIEEVVDLKADKTAVEEEQSGFSSRWAYWLSAIGCASGFGNLWRFPYLAYEYGGGAFFIPYLGCLFFIVIPLAVVEYGVAQLVQGPNVKTFASLGKRCAAPGWSIVTSANILSFYPLLLAWSGIYFINSFKSPLPWTPSDEELEVCVGLAVDLCAASPACILSGEGVCVGSILAKAEHFFHTEVLAQPDVKNGITEFSWEIMLWYLGLWTIVFFVVRNGAWIIGKVNYVATSLPFIFIVILVITGLTLDGSGDGIELYIGKFDVGVMGEDKQIWLDALAQAIFSMSAAQGSMSGYAAHNPMDQNFVMDIVIVIAGDLLFAFLAGFAVFSIIGFLSYDANIPIDEMSISGSGLAFITYPVGLAQLGSPGGNILCCIFFATLWCLGFSTVIGLLEGFVFPIVESRIAKRNGITRNMITGSCVLYFWLVSFIFCTDMGTHILDCWDHFSSELAAVFMAFSIALAVGWLMGANEQIERVGMNAYMLHSVGYIGGMCIGCIVGFIDYEAGIWMGAVVGFVIMLTTFILAWIFTHDENLDGSIRSTWDKLWEITIGNVEGLRKLLNETCCQDSCFHVYAPWGVFVKYLVPPATLYMLFSSLFAEDTLFRSPDPDYRYLWWILMIGSFTPLLLVIGVVVFFFAPSYMDFILPPVEECVYINVYAGTVTPILELEAPDKNDLVEAVKGEAEEEV